MPSGCSVPGCKRRGGGHEFPREAQRRETWIQVIRQQCQKDKWEPTKYAVVCPSHFNEGDYSCQGKIWCIDQSNLRLVACFHETRLLPCIFDTKYGLYVDWKMHLNMWDSRQQTKCIDTLSFSNIKNMEWNFQVSFYCLFFTHSWSSTSVLTSLMSFLLRDFLIVQQWLWWWQWMMTMSACLVHTCVCDFLQEREGKEISSLLQYQLYSQRTQDLCKKHLIVIWLESKSRIPHQLATVLMTYRRHIWQSTKCPSPSVK